MGEESTPQGVASAAGEKVATGCIMMFGLVMMGVLVLGLVIGAADALGLLGPSPDRGDNDVEADTVGQFDDSDEGWEPVDPNEWNGYDLDCADVGGPVEIYGIDPNGLDRDGDGIGCE